MRTAGEWPMDRERCRFGVFVLSLAAAASLPVAAAAGDGTVSGTVTDTTGLALPGVTVEARGTAGGPVLTAATDGAGEFTSRASRRAPMNWRSPCPASRPSCAR